MTFYVGGWKIFLKYPRMEILSPDFQSRLTNGQLRKVDNDNEAKRTNRIIIFQPHRANHFNYPVQQMMSNICGLEIKK